MPEALDKVISLETFLPIFLGAFLAFLSVLGAERLLTHLRNRKAKATMLRDIKEEIMMNVAILDNIIRTTQQMRNEKRMVMFLTHMREEVYQYIVASGEIRLINDMEKRSLIRSLGFLCSSFNHFLDNTELLLALFGTLLPQPTALIRAEIRLKGLLEQAEDDKKQLQQWLKQL